MDPLEIGEYETKGDLIKKKYNNEQLLLEWIPIKIGKLKYIKKNLDKCFNGKKYIDMFELCKSTSGLNANHKESLSAMDTGYVLEYLQEFDIVKIDVQKLENLQELKQFVKLNITEIKNEHIDLLVMLGFLTDGDLYKNIIFSLNYITSCPKIGIFVQTIDTTCVNKEKDKIIKTLKSILSEKQPVMNNIIDQKLLDKEIKERSDITLEDIKDIKYMKDILEQKLNDLKKLVDEEINKKYTKDNILKSKIKSSDITLEDFIIRSDEILKTMKTNYDITIKNIEGVEGVEGVDTNNQDSNSKLELELQKLERDKNIHNLNCNQLEEFKKFLDDCSTEFKWSSNLLFGNISSNNFCTVTATAPVPVN